MSASRKVTALQTVNVVTNDSDAPGGSYWHLIHVALCTDGTMWLMGSSDEWTKLTDIPQGPA